MERIIVGFILGGNVIANCDLILMYLNLIPDDLKEQR